MTIKALMCGLLATTALGAGAVTAVASNNVKKFEPTNAAAPTNTRRVWIINNDNWWTENTFYVYAWNENGTTSSEQFTRVLDDYYYDYGYCDITLEGAAAGVNVIVRYSGTDWGDYNQTVTLNLPAIGGADTIWMNSGTTYGDGHENRNASIGTTNGLGGDQLGVVLSKYDTCSANNTNGYNAYPQIKTNVFDKTATSAFGTMVYGQATYTCRDYADGMQARYEANN